MLSQEKRTVGKEERGCRTSIQTVSRDGEGFFFKMVKSCCVYGCISRPSRKEPGPRILPIDPQLFCPIAMKSGSPKKSEISGVHLPPPRTTHQDPNIFRGLQKTKTKEAYDRELILCHAPSSPLNLSPRPLAIRQVFSTINAESLFSMFSDWPSLPGRAKEGGGQEKERPSARWSDNTVNLSFLPLT